MRRNRWLLLALLGGCTTFERAEADWEAWAADHRACTTVDDCVDLGSVCPIGCSIPVAAEHEVEGRERLQRLQRQLERSGMTCDFDCLEHELACDGGTCVGEPVDTGGGG